MSVRKVSKVMHGPSVAMIWTNVHDRRVAEMHSVVTVKAVSLASVQKALLAIQ